MVSAAVALLYPSILASIASNPDLTIFPDDHGTPYLIDTSEHEFTTVEIHDINDYIRNVTFKLYTRNNPRVGERIFIDDLGSLQDTFWNSDHPTRLVTHGWRGDCDIITCTSIRDAYLSVGDYNVILVDWRDAAKDLIYWKVVNTVPLVAQHVARLINFLEDNAGLDPAKTKITGHSLGGHVAGLSARFANSEIAEVIATDPARPLYESKGPGERIDDSDAGHVQIIHTNGGLLGLDPPIGTSDFYPNGGKIQPGCGSPIDWFGMCSHSRSYQYYAESIKDPKGFRAGDVYMGGPTLDPNARGKYILGTASKSPFALG